MQMSKLCKGGYCEMCPPIKQMECFKNEQDETPQNMETLEETMAHADERTKVVEEDLQTQET